MFVVQATLAILDKLDIETDKPTEEEVAKKFGFEESYHNGEIKRQSTSSFITFFTSWEVSLSTRRPYTLSHSDPAAHQNTQQSCSASGSLLDSNPATLTIP